MFFGLFIFYGFGTILKASSHFKSLSEFYFPICSTSVWPAYSFISNVNIDTPTLRELVLTRQPANVTSTVYSVMYFMKTQYLTRGQ